MVSIYNLVNSLADYYNFKIITADRDFGEKKPYKNIIFNKWIELDGQQIFYVPKNILGLFILLNQIRTINKNSVIYLNSVFNFLFSIWIIIARKLKLVKIENVIVAPRGELFDQSLGFKSSKKKFFLWVAVKTGLYNSVLWHATTESEKNSIVTALKVNPKKIRIAPMMPSLPEETICEGNNGTQNEKLDNKELKIVYLARIAKDKNVSFAIDILGKVKAGVVFDIYGPIEDQELWNVCLKKIKMLPSNIKVNYYGIIKRADVSNTLKQYDLFFMPTFGENYGHSIAEALIVGTPVLISNKTPWRQLEADGLGWDIDLGAPSLFIEVIEYLAVLPRAIKNQNRIKIVDIINKRMNNPEIVSANKNLFKLPFD